MAAMITSAQNPLIKRIRRLAQRKYRLREGAFYVEGLRGVLAALEQGAPVELLVYSPDLLQSEVGRAVVAREEADGRQCVPVAETLFRSLSERAQPAGLAAIVATRLANPAELILAPTDLVVALSAISDPGNLGTIIRTADSAGARAVILVGQTTDPFHPGAVKASMGSLFALPLLHLPDEDALLAWARRQGATLLATSAHAAESVWDVAPAWPLLLLLGSEREGLAEEVLAAADHRVAIPMWGSATSLNLAVAAGILLFEMRRRQQR